MYCAQNRIFSGVCNKSEIDSSSTNHFKSRGQINKVLKNQCTNSMIKFDFIKNERKQNLLTM